MKKQEEIKAECDKCTYQWTTRSKLVKVSCPSCGAKVQIRQVPTPKVQR